MVSAALSAAAAVCICACAVRAAFPLLRPGAPRLAAALPVVVANFVIPRLFDRDTEFLRRGCCLLLLAWLANFKTLGYALNRGPLKRPLTLAQFILVYALPITPQEDGSGAAPACKSNSRLAHSAGPGPFLAAKSAAKLALLLGDVLLLTATDLPRIPRELAMAFCLYWFLGALMDGPGALLGWALGLGVAPHFDSPFLSASVAEFWSRRWNLTVGNSLRLLSYDPVMEGRLVSTGAPFRYSRPRRVAAITAAFVVSGAMHEVMIWHLDPAAATGQWLAFFSLQAPVVVLESLLLRALRARGLQPPAWLAVPLALGALLAMGHWLFFPPAVDSGLELRFFASVRRELGLREPA